MLSGSIILDIANYIRYLNIKMNSCTLISILKTKINSYNVASLSKLQGIQMDELVLVKSKNDITK